LNLPRRQKAYNAREGIETNVPRISIFFPVKVRKHTMLERALRLWKERYFFGNGRKVRKHTMLERALRLNLHYVILLMVND